MDFGGVAIGLAVSAMQMDQSHSQHAESTKEGRLANDIAITSDIIMTLLQADSDITFARGEAERDLYEQKNQQLQTLIISSSIMIGAQISIFIQGILPDGTSDLITSSFGLANGLSFALLFLAIIYCLEISRRSSEFMVSRSKTGANTSRACHDAHQQFYERVLRDINERNEVHLSVTNQWYRNLYTQIRKAAATIFQANNNLYKVNDTSFQDLWDGSVDSDFIKANAFFYWGSIFLLLACLLWAWAQFQIKYKSNLGAYLAIAPILLAIFAGINIVCKYNNEYDDNIRGSTYFHICHWVYNRIFKKTRSNNRNNHKNSSNSNNNNSHSYSYRNFNNVNNYHSSNEILSSDRGSPLNLSLLGGYDSSIVSGSMPPSDSLESRGNSFSHYHDDDSEV